MKKQVLVSVERGETRVAILESKQGEQKRTPKQGKQPGKKPARSPSVRPEWKVAEIYIERPSTRTIVGNIYKGKVDNVLPGLEAAFVDIGLEKNGFLHVDDILVPEKPNSQHRSQQRHKIGDLLKKGQEIAVQAVKDPLRTKGPRLSMELAVAGRYMVYLPSGEGVGISRRLPDKERDRLRKIAANLDIKKGGAIVRTAAQGAKKNELEREVGFLFKLQEILTERTDKIPAPNLIFQEADLPIRVIRDLYSQEFERAIVDDDQQHQRLLNFFRRTAPDLVDSVELYKGKQPLFEKFGVESELRSTLSRRVDLKSGGYLVIDYTEALTVIDVNTGSFTGKGRSSLEDTITQTNLEATEEVVRQLRLRDIGGIIVIDFIDMERVRNRTQVLEALQKYLDRDRTKTYVMEISPLGLVEMTRQNVTDGVREIMTKQCEVCNGEGVVLAEDTVAIDVERKLRDLASGSQSEAYIVRLHPRVADLLRGDEGEVLRQIEDESGKQFYFQHSEAEGIETFAVVDEGESAQMQEQVVPFTPGEEVMLLLQEPHRFNSSDAAVTVNGYLITVKDAVEHVGTRKLVRIESVSRVEAVATLPEEYQPQDKTQRPGGKVADKKPGADERGDEKLESQSERQRTGPLKVFGRKRSSNR